MFAYALTWYFWTVVTYGVWVPAGLFLPGIIIGCSVGGLYALFQLWLFGNTIEDTLPINGGTNVAVTFVLVGAGAMTAFCDSVRRL